MALTELGKKYVSASERESKEILRNQIEDIEIFKFLLRRLRIKKEISIGEVFELIEAIRGKKYTQNPLLQWAN